MDMLVSRSKPEINDIVTIKLNNGEEVVGRLTEFKADSVILAKPIQISIQPIGPKQIGLAFAPFLASAPDTPSVQISFSAMAVRPVKTSDDVARNYTQATTGLVTPSPGEAAGIISAT